LMDKATKALARRVAALEKLVHALRNTPGKQNHESVGNAHETDGECNRLSEGAPGLTDRKPDPKRTDDTQKKWYETFKGWKSRIQFAALIAGIGYAVVTYFEWKDLRHNFEVDQRPWITYHKTDDVLLKPGSPIVFRFDLVNTGKTPARGVTGFFSPMIVDSSSQSFSLPKTRIYPPPARSFNFEVGIVAPNVEQHFVDVTVLREGAQGPVIVDQALWMDLQSQQRWVLMWGQIDYTDNFGNPHWLRVCRPAWLPMEPPIQVPESTRHIRDECMKFNNADKN
jgi:hypothetical protein